MIAVTYSESACGPSCRRSKIAWQSFSCWLAASLFEEEFATFSEVKYIVGVDSGTAALDLALCVQGIGRMLRSLRWPTRMSIPAKRADDPNSVHDRRTCHFCGSSIRRQAK